MISLINKIDDVSSKTAKKIVIIISILVYVGSIFSQFVYDDRAFVLRENNFIKPSIETIFSGEYPLAETGVYRPVRGVLYAITDQLFIKNSSIYHGFTLLLHIVISSIVFDIAATSFKSKRIGLFSAILFTIHPVHVESVVWITAGYDLIFILFYLLAFKSHIAHKSSNKKYIYALLAFFSNELALTIPIVFIIYDLLKSKKINDVEKRNTPYILMAIAYWLVRVNIIQKFVEMPRIYENIWEGILFSMIIFGKYLSKLLLPIKMSVDPILYEGVSAQYYLNHNPSLPTPAIPLNSELAWFPLLLVVVYLFYLWWVRKKPSTLLFYGLWIIVTLLPVLQIVPFTKLFAIRYTYLPSVGFSIISGYVLSKLWDLQRLKKVILSITLIVFGAYSIQTIANGFNWKNEKSLWEYTLNLNSDSLASLNGLGFVYSQAGEREVAMKYFEKAYSANPYVEKFQKNILVSYVEFERYEDVIRVITHIQNQRSLDFSLMTLLAQSYEKTKNFDKAIETYLQIINQDPQNKSAKESLARLGR